VKLAGDTLTTAGPQRHHSADRSGRRVDDGDPGVPKDREGHQPGGVANEVLFREGHCDGRNPCPREAQTWSALRLAGKALASDDLDTKRSSCSSQAMAAAVGVRIGSQPRARALWTPSTVRAAKDAPQVTR